MSIGLYSTKISADVLTRGEAASRAYREFPDVGLYWCLVDLVQSSNYRLSQGPERGYLRGESFFALVEAAIRPYAEVRSFKEIGDAVLLCCRDPRPIFESCVLMAVAARQLEHVAASETFPFAIRLGIDFGIGKMLSRPHEDYLGEPIDRLARIMSVRSERTNLLVSENAYTQNRKVIAEYSFCEVSEPRQLQLPSGKALTELVIYREVTIRYDQASSFDDFFSEWKLGPSGLR